MTRDDALRKTLKDHFPIRRDSRFDLLVFVVLASIAIATRLLPHAPGFVAVTGAALFAGWYVRKAALAFVLPLCVLLASDVVIGFYEPMVMAAVYFCAVLPIVLARSVHRKPEFMRLTCFLLLCSIANFFFINFFVWLGSGWYDRSPSGLIQCYTAALPFFKYRLAGDVCWTTLFFVPHIVAAMVTRSSRLRTRQVPVGNVAALHADCSMR